MWAVTRDLLRPTKQKSLKILRYSWKKCKKIKHSKTSEEKSESDSKSKTSMKSTNLKKKSSLINSKESKKTWKSNKMSSPRKQLRAVTISLSIKNLWTKLRPSPSFSSSIIRACSIVSYNVWSDFIAEKRKSLTLKYKKCKINWRLKERSMIR